jgi:hypothetical protein
MLPKIPMARTFGGSDRGRKHDNGVGSWRRLTIGLSVAVTVLGCQPERQPETEDVVAGEVSPDRQPETEFVVSADAGASPQLTVVEAARLGSLSDPDIGFSVVTAVAVGPDRRMYVAEGQDRHVRIYDAAGNLERVVGRQGQGPGEFQSLLKLGLLGDTLWVVDPGNGRISLFNRDGDLIGTVAAPRIATERGSLFPMYLRPDRNWVSGGVSGTPVAGAISTYTSPELLFDVDGALVDTLRNVEIVAVPAGVAIDSISMPREALLPDHPIILHDPGTRTMIVRRASPTSNAPSSFSIASISISGDTVFDISLEYAPIPVDDAYVDRVVEQLAAGPRARLGAARIERALRSALPAYHPPVTQVRLGEDGTIWLRRERDRANEARYLIIESDGVVRGSVRLPGTVQIMWSGRDELVGMEPDDFDVPWLIRYRFR